MDTHHYDKDMTASDDKVLEMTLEKAESMEDAMKNDENSDEDEDNEEAADMEEFEESGMLEDDRVR